MLSGSQPSPVAPGEIVDGKYRVEEVLGVGGMGVVVAATHIELGQRVAVKFLLPVAVHAPGATERFLREARAAASLRSQHVARTFDVDRLPSGTPYLVMEYLAGSDLGMLVRDLGPLRVADAVEYVIQACEAVAEAHSLGIVHRDLKPSNLFLTRRLNGAPLVKVLDFGISKIATDDDGRPSLTKTSDVVGSPYYMAPEQVRSAKAVDERTDIWALGVILYELLSGKVPFAATNVPQLCAMVLERQPPSLASWRPALPEGLVELIHRCLQKDPGQRFQNVVELVQALAPYAGTGAAEAEASFYAVAASGGPAPGEPLPLPVRSSLTLGATVQQTGRTLPLPQGAERASGGEVAAGVAALGDSTGMTWNRSSARPPRSRKWYAAAFALVAVGLGLASGLLGWMLSGREPAETSIVHSTELDASAPEARAVVASTAPPLVEVEPGDASVAAAGSATGAAAEAVAVETPAKKPKSSGAGGARKGSRAPGPTASAGPAEHPPKPTGDYFLPSDRK